LRRILPGPLLLRDGAFGFETNLVALENSVPPDRILFGTDFPAVTPEMAGWYTKNVDAYFADRPELLAQVMHGNAHALLPRLPANTVR
jgi:6-methylsalicylate decarboxylase